MSILKASYDEIRRERDRLRDARGWASRQLGPLPAAAGLSTGIIAAFSGYQNGLWLGAAVFFLVAMLVVSFRYSGMQSYRQMRADKESAWREELRAEHPELAGEADQRGLLIEDVLGEPEWYVAMLKLERSLYGPLDRADNRYGPPRSKPSDLQDAFDRERTGLFVVQGLFAVVVACLILSRVT